MGGEEGQGGEVVEGSNKIGRNERGAERLENERKRRIKIRGEVE